MAPSDYLVGIPYGFDTSSSVYPPTNVTPSFKIWWPETNVEVCPTRNNPDFQLMPGTRVLPNGVKIDKFQGYTSPRTFSREVWGFVNWDSGFRAVNFMTGSDGGSAISNNILGERVAIYIASKRGSTADINWAAARCERIKTDIDMGLSDKYVVVTVEFERLSGWTWLGQITF